MIVTFKGEKFSVEENKALFFVHCQLLLSHNVEFISCPKVVLTSLYSHAIFFTANHS